MRVEIRDGLESRPDVGPLAAAVYPPEVLANIVWRSVVSARATRRVLVYDDDGSLVAAAGVLFRTGTLNSSKSNIAGIGGVMTLPTRQREGFGSVAMNAAHQLVARESTSAFGLLFCEPKNFSFYHSLGWSLFAGTVIAEQPTSTAPYTVMPALVHAFLEAAPAEGTIELGGLPW